MSSFSSSQELLISTVLVVLLSLYLYLYFRFRRVSIKVNPAVLLRRPNWPILGTLPYIVASLHNIHGHLSVLLARYGHSLMAHGPLGTRMRLFVTCDAANVRHIFTTNFRNYQKGAEFTAIFDILDGTAFTADGELWRRQRGKMQSVLSSPRMVARMAACCRDKLENGLLPLLNHMESNGTPFDMQELMMRFMFDLVVRTVIGVDPGILSPDMPPMDVSAAMDIVMEVGFVRHLMPASCWKAMRFVNIGPERKLAGAHKILRGFFSEIMRRRKMIEGGYDGSEEDADAVFILSSFITDPDYSDEFVLRANLFGYMLAGRDTIATTLPWIFYNLAQNPDTVSAIRNELSPIASRKVAGTTMLIFEANETRSLIYLRAALYETLRLYPPAPIERKTAGVDDIMPSGHEVHAGDTIFVSIYSMGRNEDIWGKDCLDYNPDRWLSTDGKMLRHVPSHEFLAFNSGPRICPGKEIAVMQMKTIVAAVVWNFDILLLEGQSIQPKLSCLLQMKNGLTVKLQKRVV